MARQPRPWPDRTRDAWYVWLGGKKVRLAKGLANKKEAQAAFHRLMATGPTADPADGLLVDQLLFRFMAHCSRALDPKTTRFYLRHLEGFKEMWWSTPAASVRPWHVNEWLAAHPGWNPTTRAGAVAAVKRAFRWAMREGLLDGEPLKTLEKPQARRREAIMTPEQARAAIDAYAPGDPFRDFLEALYETGARPGEAAGLTAAMVDLAEGTWTVPNKTRRSTGRPTRTIYLSPRAVELTRRLVERHPDGPLFRNRLGGPWKDSAVAMRFRRLKEKLGWGKEAAAYALRHGFATAALEAGVPIATVAELMGHASTLTISRVYSHLGDRKGHLRAAAAAVRPAVAPGAGDATQSPEPAPPAPEPPAPPAPAPRKRRGRTR